MSIHKPPVIKRHIRLQKGSTKVIYRATTDIRSLEKSPQRKLRLIESEK